MLLLALLLVPAVFAVGSGNGVLRNGAMAGVMADVECKTTFNVGILDSYVDAIPNSSSVLNPLIETLESDTATLQGYATSNNTEDFRMFLRETYEKDSKNAKEALSRVRRSASLDNATKTQLRVVYDRLKSEYQSCHVEAVRLFASSKVELYEGHLSNLDEKIRSLEEKGVDSSRLKSLVSDARENIVSPLRSAITSGDSAALVRAATREYCLYNGCPNGTAYHLAARFEIEKLDALLTRIKGTNTSSVEELILKADEDLNDAKELLSTGSSSVEVESQIWLEIRSCASTIQQIIREIKENGNSQRREEVRERVDEIRNATRERVEQVRNASITTRERIEEVRNQTQERIEERRERVEDIRSRIRSNGSTSAPVNVSADATDDSGRDSDD